MNNSFHLLRLQQKDIQIQELQIRIKEIETSISYDAEVNALMNELTELHAIIRPIEQKINQISSEIAEKKLKIEQSNSALYGGTIKNPKELQNLQEEISSINRAIENHESEALQLMSDLEIHQNNRLEIESKLHTCQNLFQSRISLLSGEKINLLAALERYLTEKSTISSQINQDAMSLYEKLRISKNGIAITTLDDDSCSACGSVLTPAQCQQSKSTTSYFFCPSCGRIIYAG